MELKFKIFKKRMRRLLVLWIFYKYPILSSISAEFWCYLFIMFCIYLRIHQYDLLDVCYDILVLKSKEYSKSIITSLKIRFKRWYDKNF